MSMPLLRRLIVLLCAATLAWPAAAAAPTARPEEVGLSSERLKRVSELMARHIADATFPGAVTLVARDGRIAHFEVHGLMDLESKRPMQKDAIFRIMSMTKPVVAVAVMMLVEEGKIRLTDPVTRFIPELQGMSATVVNSDGRIGAAPSGIVGAPLPARTVPVERDLSVRDLLTHTSGLMSGGLSSSATAETMPKPGETLADVIPRLQKVPLDFQPGTRWAYSAQFGFDVLARVVEVASGLPFDQFARQRIFDPLGMKDTSFNPVESPRIASLYERTQAGALRKFPNPTWMNSRYFSGGGGLFSTAEDYLQFALMLLNRGQLEGKRVLSPRSVDLMASAFAPDTMPGRTPGEAFGLSVRVVTDSAARTTYASDGTYGWSGAFNTHFFIDPAERLIGIFMTQSAFLATRGQLRDDFEAAVMQSIVGPGTVAATN